MVVLAFVFCGPTAESGHDLAPLEAGSRPTEPPPAKKNPTKKCSKTANQRGNIHTASDVLLWPRKKSADLRRGRGAILAVCVGYFYRYAITAS